MMDEPCERAVTRFCRQYLQLEPHLDYPPDSYLRQPQVQEAIYSRLFEDGAIRYGPPTRYEVKTLKTLVSRIEGSIDNWDEHVSLLLQLGCATAE
jgi:predicted HD phosphohydrolase